MSACRRDRRGSNGLHHGYAVSSGSWSCWDINCTSREVETLGPSTMSLYNLAEDLFADIDRVRVAAPKPRSDARTHMRSTDNDQENIRIVNEVKLPLLRFSPRDGDTPQTPTLELLEGCLRDIHKVCTAVFVLYSFV